MDFGKYFRSLLNEKQVSVADLAGKLNIKSKNEIYRLFQNKYSYEKTSQLTERILSVIDVPQSEKNELYRLMNECKIGYSVRTANAILSKLYMKEYTEKDSKFRLFMDFIKENSKKKITIYIGMIHENQSIMLNKAIGDNSDIQLIQTVDFNTTDEKIARQLFAVVTFFPNNNHKLFECLGQSDNAVLAIAEDDTACIMAVFDNGVIHKSNISKDMAKYIHETKLASCGKELKQNRVRLADYEQMLQYTCECDLHETYAFHGMICLAEIPFKILYRLFEDANYFGFPINHPFIQSLIEVEKKHDELRKVNNTPHLYFLSENYIKKFLSTGITSGYIREFRPLNPAERIETFKIFDYSGKGVQYKGRFFKDGYDAITTECCNIDDVGVYITDSQSVPKKHICRRS